MATAVNVGRIKIGGKNPLVLIAGPCVIESRQACLSIAGKLTELCRRQKIPFIFKASYDKANRTSLRSYRGPGLVKGLEILMEVKENFGVPVLTDVHSAEDVSEVAVVADVVQIPAFLCRQTDIVIAAGESGRPVNIKKAQFLAPWDVRNVIEKIESTGNRRIMVTERGTCFGYNNLVSDMRSLLVLRDLGYPVVFDATHSVQRPGGVGDRTAGDGKWAPDLARAAVAVGCDAVFIETHVNPRKALSDADNAIPLADLGKLWRVLRKIDEIAG